MAGPRTAPRTWSGDAIPIAGCACVSFRARSAVFRLDEMQASERRPAIPWCFSPDTAEFRRKTFWRILRKFWKPPGPDACVVLSRCWRPRTRAWVKPLRELDRTASAVARLRRISPGFSIHRDLRGPTCGASLRKWASLTKALTPVRAWTLTSGCDWRAFALTATRDSQYMNSLH